MCLSLRTSVTRHSCKLRSVAPHKLIRLVENGLGCRSTQPGLRPSKYHWDCSSSEWLLSVNTDWGAWHPCSGGVRTVYTHKFALSSRSHINCQFGNREFRVCKVQSGYRLETAQSIARHWVPVPQVLEWVRLFSDNRHAASWRWSSCPINA